MRTVPATRQRSFCSARYSAANLLAVDASISSATQTNFEQIVYNLAMRLFSLTVKTLIIQFL